MHAPSTPHRSARQAAFNSAVLLLILFSACTPTPATPAPATATVTPPPIANTLPPAPSATPTPLPTTVPAGPQLAPAGESGKTYYAPLNVSIKLDGDLSDWQGVPRVTIPAGADPTSGKPAVTFAAAADSQYLYCMGDVIDSNIIAGQHDTNYWNEDSVEFYINGTGDLGLKSYVDGVAQITVPAVDIGKSPDEAVVGGVNGSSAEAKVMVVKTATGWATEVAVPLVNKVWQIAPSHGAIIGFQVHLNGASTANRDTKLIWSVFDQSDASYQDPSLFGQLIFYEIGKTDLPVFQPTPKAPPTATLPAPEADAPYKDPQLPVDQRVEDLLPRMSLGEKIGQMTLVEKNSMASSGVSALFIGGVLSGGGGYPSVNTPAYWAKMVNRFQRYALETRLGIPIIYGVDAVHGHNNVRGTVIFPHNIGLGAANDEDLMRRIGRVTALEMVATGIHWNYAPVVAVPQDIRWGRTYEGYGENTDLVSRLSVAYLQGLQGDDLSSPDSVAATLKHYVGDGGTGWGTSTTSDYKLDQGVTQGDETVLRAIHLPPYIRGVDAGAVSVMVSFSSWGGIKMHAQKYLITDVLKGELGFKGFVVSDWGGVDQVSAKYYDAVVASVNAGVDMNMVPYNYTRFISTLTLAVEKGDVTMERIDDAVRRILRAKFEMGLFEHPYANEDGLAAVGSDEHRAVAREAVAKSAVLLKNDNSALPLSRSEPLLYVAGLGANDIGMQLGGWSIEWQGKLGDATTGTTILKAITSTVSSATQVVYSVDGNFPGTAKAGACIAVVGEQPYAEGVGDRADLSLSAEDIGLTERMRPRCDKLIVLLISGRPMIVTDQLPQWDAFVALWLPGTEGEGVADVLFGDRPFTGKLSYTWPRSMDQLPFDFKNLPIGANGVLFPYGFGLTAK